jgi:capsular polysaccharide biosynthesis protein
MSRLAGSFLGAVIGWCWCASVLAGQAPESAARCANTAADSAPRKPCKRPARRAVRQDIVPVTPIGSPPAPLAASPPPGATRPAPTRAAPVPLLRCEGNVCRDTEGQSYNGGVGRGAGNAATDSQGRLCTREGQWMQCF